MVRVMNLGHRSLTRWGLSQLPDAQYREILDCGCGGGAAIKRLLRACPQSAVWGVDYSAVSVQAARRAANVGKRRFPACCRKKCAGCRIAAFCLFCVSEQICTAPFQTNFLHNLPFSANKYLTDKGDFDMKATGIVRRIDDLGRVVIPKEIRRTLRIREGDPLEIYTEKDGEVIFKKYSPMGDLTDFAGQICESIGKNTGHIAAVCDRDTMIAAYGVQRRELMDKHCSQELEQLMESRKIYRYQPGQAKLHPTDSSERYYLGVSAPILSEGDLMGCVMLLLEEQDEPLGDAEQKLVQTVAGFLGRQMES